MAQLWGGRFKEQTSDDAFRFNASISFDIRLLDADIEGSLAHTRMLEKQGILTKEEAAQILQGLQEIRTSFQEADGPLDLSEYEDVHSYVESELIRKIGDAGKKLHTGRSRNDQVALDMRLYTREQVNGMRGKLYRMLKVLHGLMETHLTTVMPGFTHLQKAQPVTLAHHFGAYFAMFSRDEARCRDLFHRMNVSPLGAGALAGTTYPLDRTYTAKALSFDGVCDNSMDAVSDRDYLVEYLAALSLVMMHLSRFAEEMILWNSDEYRFVTIDDAYSTGSSIMPQKKNPDIAELTRGKTGRVYGDLLSLLTTLKGLPLAYNKDMQEDKEAAFDAFDTVNDCLTLFTDMVASTTFHQDMMARSAAKGFTNATDAADYLVRKGVPFRDAHGIIGQLVLYCIDKGCAIGDLSLPEFKQFSDAFEEDVYEAVSLQTCVERRLTYGAPGVQAMREVLAEHETYLKALAQELQIA